MATEVAFACTGARPRGHSFQADQLTELFEQLVVSLHKLPAAPVPYIRQSSEPDLLSDAHVRLVVGLSGAGKTAWVAHSALHSQHTVYLDAAATLPTALASAIAREVAARFLQHGDNRAREAILPGASGLEALSALSAFAADSTQEVRLVCDNAHSAGLEALRHVIPHAPAFHWTLVARPCPDVAGIATYFGIRSEHLGGFSLEAIADVFSAHGCTLTVTTADAIRDISAGLPLFVKDAARLTARAYGADPHRFVAAVRAGTHAQSTGQEVILNEVVRTLSPGARVTAALLSLSEVHLEHEECLRFVVDATGDESAAVAAYYRELLDWGVAQQYFTGSISLHDAFGLPAATLRRQLPATTVDRGRRSLASVLRASFGHGDFDRLMMFFKLAPQVGESATLVDVSNSLGEYIQERGKADELVRALEDASNSGDVDPINRFWAYDTVTFWKMRDSAVDEVEALVRRLEALHQAVPEPGDASRQSLLMKQMLLAGRRGDATLVRSRYRDLSEIPGDRPELRRVLRYDYALSLYYCQCLPEARIVTASVMDEYLRKFGLTGDDLLGTSVPRLAEMLGDKRNEYEELKRFADTLALQARIVIALQFTSGLLRIWAHKLYVLGQAPASAVTVGLDVVDEMLELLNDAPAARQFMENALLPTVTEFRLLGHLLDVRATYAVVLAYCGEVTEARKITSKLAVFKAAPLMSGQLQHQRDLIERIAGGEVRLTPGNKLPLPGPILARGLRPGRNAPCVCGSGLKFKRCCGRYSLAALDRAPLADAGRATARHR